MRYKNWGTKRGVGEGGGNKKGGFGCGCDVKGEV